MRGADRELNEKLGGIDVRNLDRERKKLITQQDELIREVGHKGGGGQNRGTKRKTWRHRRAEPGQGEEETHYTAG